MSRAEWTELEMQVHRAASGVNALSPLLSELVGSVRRSGKLLDSLAQQADGLRELPDPVIVGNVPHGVGSVGRVLRDVGGLTETHDSSPSVDGTGSATVGDGVDAGAAPASTHPKSNVADRRSGSRMTSQSLSSFTAGGLVFSVTIDDFLTRNSVLTVSNAWAGISMSTELPARRSAGN